MVWVERIPLYATFPSKILYRMPSRKAKRPLLTLPNTGNELKVAIWASGTPEQFFLHVHTAMQVCKQFGLDTNEADSTMELDAAYCMLEAAKAEYDKLAKNMKKNAKEQKEKGENPDPDATPTLLHKLLLRNHAR